LTSQGEPTARALEAEEPRTYDPLVFETTRSYGRGVNDTEVRTQTDIDGKRGVRAYILSLPSREGGPLPHSVMSWRHHRAVCGYAVLARDSEGERVLCVSPHRTFNELIERFLSRAEAVTGVESAPGESSSGQRSPTRRAERRDSRSAASTEPEGAVRTKSTGLRLSRAGCMALLRASADRCDGFR
jgi:hypothetical protein